MPRIVWLDQQGHFVIHEVIARIVDECGINHAAHHIAKLSEVENEAAIDLYKMAVACFEKQHFTKKRGVTLRVSIATIPSLKNGSSSF